MAGIAACARVRTVASLNMTRRGVHQSAVALAAKKKGKAGAKNDDPFADDEDMFGFSDGDDLFAPKKPSASSSQSTSSTASSATVHAASTAPAAPSTHGSMSPQKRLRRFNALYQFAGDRIGARPALPKAPEQVRDTVWQQLFQLATTGEQMEAVVALFPRWRDSNRRFTAAMSEAFVRRCEELHCPQLALAVFADHPKHGVDLTASGARRLMHALHAEHPLPGPVLLAALHAVYALPAVSRDFVECAMFAAACFRAGMPDKAVAKDEAEATEKEEGAETATDAIEATDVATTTEDAQTQTQTHTTQADALTLAHSLLPALRTLLQNADPATYAYPPKGGRTDTATKEKVWLTWSLLKIETALRKRGELGENGWLSVWRERSGQGRVAGA